jgi:hypothetical protein
MSSRHIEILIAVGLIAAIIGLLAGLWVSS